MVQSPVTDSSNRCNEGGGMKVDFSTHEQAMACLTCGLAGFTPESHFPQDDGLWDQPCPQCGSPTVWVTEMRERAHDGT